jgi:hypothetical protein
MDTSGINMENEIELVRVPAATRFLASVLSVLFHPLFIPLYVSVFLMYWHPTVFAGFSAIQKIRILGTIFVNLTLLPAFTVFLLWRLKFIDNIFLKTTKERIIPYAAMMFFGFWAWNVFNHLAYSPPLFTDFLLGTFIAVIAGWLANIYYKISMHGLAIGGMLFFVIYLSLTTEGSGGQYISAALLIAGLTATSRLLVSDHKGFDVYSGILVGAASQLIAATI